MLLSEFHSTLSNHHEDKVTFEERKIRLAVFVVNDEVTSTQQAHKTEIKLGLIQSRCFNRPLLNSFCLCEKIIYFLVMFLFAHCE